MDGSGDRGWTEGDARLPGKHMGNGCWHPSGRWLVFTAEKAEHQGGSFEATPGFSGYNDVWAQSADGSWVRPLTDFTVTIDKGAMIPRFSPDGKSLVWTAGASDKGCGAGGAAFVALGAFAVLGASGLRH